MDCVPIREPVLTYVHTTRQILHCKPRCKCNVPNNVPLHVVNVKNIDKNIEVTPGHFTFNLGGYPLANIAKCKITPKIVPPSIETVEPEAVHIKCPLSYMSTVLITM